MKGGGGRPTLLVHVCCAPDALYVLGLLRETHDVTGYFYNPNIQPPEEYKRRLEETVKAAGILGLPLLEGPRDFARWSRATRKFRDEPEKGRRCDVCYALRLLETARRCAELGMDACATVMSLSPWKKADALNRIGRMSGRRLGVGYLESDFKKKDGFRRSVALSREHGLYRQDYCGCLYSRRPERVAGEPGGKDDGEGRGGSRG
ncbi:MAG: epoxyqueuosine reductase QueH [Candidatus Aminicenantes bacterium]|nr:epoxyqueuosine reductase QueH [Candidatus Aminicenantes bacterium]